MTELIRGIVQIMGQPGAGKSTFAMGAPVASPGDISVFNFDHKPYPDIEYGFYQSYLHMLSDVNGDGTSESRMIEQVLKDLDKAKGTRVATFDAWEMFSKGLVSYVKSHASDYKQFIGGGTILVMSQLGWASVVETALLDHMYSKLGIETIFVINHLQHEYDSNGVRTGRKVPRSSARLREKARLILWIQPNPDPQYQCPTAVILKDPGIHTWDQTFGGLRGMRMLPEKLNPAVLDVAPGSNISLWDIIRHYQKNPVGDRLLTSDEQATPEEYSMISGTLTPDQKAVWEKNQEIAQALGGMFTRELGSRIDELRQNSVPFTDARKTLIEEGLLDEGISLMNFKKMYA